MTSFIISRDIEDAIDRDELVRACEAIVQWTEGWSKLQEMASNNQFDEARRQLSVYVKEVIQSYVTKRGKDLHWKVIMVDPFAIDPDSRFWIAKFC